MKTAQYLDGKMEKFTNHVQTSEITEEVWKENLSPDALPIILASLYVIVFIFSTVLNTIFLVIYFRKISLRNISNRFIVSLTLSNLVTAWTVIPITIFDLFVKSGQNSEDTNSRSIQPILICAIFEFLTYFAFLASIISTLLIALDRYIAIARPLRYHVLMTKTRSVPLCVCAWIFAAVFALASTALNHKTNWNVCTKTDIFPYEFINSAEFQKLFAFLEFAIYFAIPLILLIWFYSQIYKAAQENSARNRRNSQNNHLANSVYQSTEVARRTSSTKSSTSQLVFKIRRRFSNASVFMQKEEARTAKISVTVVFLFFITWFPFFCAKIITLFADQERLSPKVFSCTLLLSVFNTVLSSYVYVFRSKNVRREIKRFFGIKNRSAEIRDLECPPFNYHLDRLSILPSVSNYEKCLNLTLNEIPKIHFKEKSWIEINSLEIAKSDVTKYQTHNHLLNISHSTPNFQSTAVLTDPTHRVSNIPRVML